MIEIVFGENAEGSLKIAQNYGKGKYLGGSIGVIIKHEDGGEPTKREIEEAQRKAEEKERLAWEQAVPLGGTSGDVFGFSLALSIGDIAGAPFFEKRWNVLEKLYAIYPNDEGAQAARELWQKAERNAKMVYERIAAGEDVRIWYSNQPDERCGLYWFIAYFRLLREEKGNVYLVRLPDWEEDGAGNMMQKTSWGDMAPGEWHRYLSKQELASPAFYAYCTAQWETLRRENAPLRVVVNGKLTGMPETFYDEIIMREIGREKEVFREAPVVGRVLGKYQLGIGDAWVAYRIQKMIEAGKLKVVEEAAGDLPTYCCTLQKCF